MNLLLLSEEDRIEDNLFRVSGERFVHLKKVLRRLVGEKVYCGLLNGKMGFLNILKIEKDFAVLKGFFTDASPEALSVRVLIAMQRPKMLKRIFRDMTMLGVKDITVFNSAKVEKDFWKTDFLEEKNYRKYLLSGLSQCKDTIVPKVKFRKRFKPFLEDELSLLSKDSLCLICHPGGGSSFSSLVKRNLTLAIGPEGGFTDFEINKFLDCGFKPAHIGRRVLRTEVAVISLLAQYVGNC